MQLKTGRFGKYFGCTNADCKNTRKLLRNGEPAPPKMDPVPMPELACEKVDDTLRAARRCCGSVSGGKPVSPAPGDARAAGA
jgi:hypothetical protein